MRTIGVDIRVLSTGRQSGIEEYTEQILAHMIPLTDDIEWKLFYNGHTPLRRRDWMDSPRVHITNFGLSNRRTLLSTRIFNRPFLDQAVGSANVFFFPHFLLGALSPTCRRVMTWHDLSYERMPYLLSPYRRMWHALQMRPRAQALSADRIIAVSSSTAKDVCDIYAIQEGNISIIPSGINPAVRRASELEQRQWRGVRNIDAPFILALGTREPRKNLPALIRAWDLARQRPACAHVHLVLAGHDGWRDADIRRALRAVRAPHAVHVLENIEQSEKNALLSSASVLAYPSLMEGFGFPPLEAMACGTPVLASATSSLIDIVGNAGVLVDPYRIDGMTEALVALHTDAALRSRMISRGLYRASLYRWETSAQSTLRAILSVL